MLTLRNPMELWQVWPKDLDGHFGISAPRSTWCNTSCFTPVNFCMHDQLPKLVSLAPGNPRLSMEHQIADPNCQWVLNPHSSDLTFFDLFCMLNAHTTRNLGGIFCFLANKAQVAGQMKTWLVKFREAPGIACIQHGYAIEFCPGFYFPTEGSGIVLVRWNYSLVAALPAPGPELAEIRT